MRRAAVINWDVHHGNGTQQGYYRDPVVLTISLHMDHDSFVDATGIEVTGKKDLLCRSDFVSLNCDLNPSSHHIIGPSELALMKSTAYLVNTARGPLIDEAALVTALRDQGIAGAGLDVFESEPIPTDSGLRALDNCLLAPHNANSSPEAYERVHNNTIKNLLRELSRAQK